MPRLIRAHNLKAKVFTEIHDEASRKRIMELINEAEPCEPTNCINCRFYDLARAGCNGFCLKHNFPSFPWDYCSWGERLSNESNRSE